MRQIMSCDRALALFETIWRCLFPEHSKFRQKESNFNANCNILGVDPKEVRKRTYLIQNCQNTKTRTLANNPPIHFGQYNK